MRFLSGGLGTGKQDLVLSIGCGTCKFEGRLAELVHGVVGLDISDVALAIAKANVPPNIQLIRSGEMDPSFVPDSCFDMVISLSTFQHLPAKTVKAYLRDCLRVLKPKGMLKCNIIERTAMLKEGVKDILKLRVRLGVGRVLEGTLLWGDHQVLQLPSWSVGKPWSRREFATLLQGIGFQGVRSAHSSDIRVPESLMVTAKRVS